jgi:uncharacterized protein YceK
MKKTTLSIIATLMLISGCSSVPIHDIQVETRIDSKAAMSGYKTYAWLGSAAIVNDPYGQWTLPEFDADAEIKYLIDRELRKKNILQSSPFADPDMIITFAAGIDMDVFEVKVDPSGTMSALNVPQGGLAVMLADNQTGFIIWMGVATADVQDRPDTKTAKARLDHAITELFWEFPK